jgi:hypothetical protein
MLIVLAQGASAVAHPIPAARIRKAKATKAAIARIA